MASVVASALAALTCVAAPALTAPAAWAETYFPGPTTITDSYAYTGVEQTFDVPAGIFQIHVLAIGANGGNGDEQGGTGAQASATVSVTPGQTLYVEVGGNGQTKGAGQGGFNGGGSGGGEGSGGGGGASDVRTSPLALGLTPEDRLIVAAGGAG
ncbi:MAG TPA: glycine-rich protein, partial [Solirubrobacteraceae bacterium]|nr:glycine-rich protein [Solirubrobacteraceae bacterium]